MSPEAVSARPRRRIQAELAPSSQPIDKNRENRVGRGESQRNPRADEAQEAAVYRRERRARGRRSEEAPSPVESPSTSPTPPPATTQPVGGPTPVEGSTDTRSLAERYVAQYEAKSGHTLTDEERAAKVKEVADFYGDTAHQGRLEKLVFA